MPGDSPGILIVDDDPTISKICQIMLRGEGFCVQLAADGSTALQLYREDPGSVQLVLLDVGLTAEMDGPQTADALRLIDPDVCCCFMTGGSSRYSDQDLLDRGAACVLQKPLAFRQLPALLRCLFQEHKQHGRDCQVTPAGGRATRATRSAAFTSSASP